MIIKKIKLFIKAIIPQFLLINKLPKNKLKKTVLFTFDDGPHPEITPKILELLDHYNAKAIFFVPGRRIQRSPDLLSQIINKGHLIGNHTFTHLNKGRNYFFPYRRDLIRCQEIIKKTCGITPFFFRSARGEITLTTLIVPQLIGLKNINWSIEFGEWGLKCVEEAKEMIDKVILNIKSGDIILLHDDNPYSEMILSKILSELQKKGFDFKIGLNDLQKIIGNR